MRDYLIKNKWLRFFTLFIIGYCTAFSVNAAIGMFTPDSAVVYTFALYLIIGFIFGTSLNVNKLVFLLPVVFHFALLYYLLLTADRAINEVIEFMLPFLLLCILVGFALGWYIRALLKADKKKLSILILLFCIFSMYYIKSNTVFYVFTYEKLGYIKKNESVKLDYTLVNSKEVVQEFTGKIKIIQLFSLSCGSCRVQHEELLEDLEVYFVDDSVSVIAVNSFVKDDFSTFKEFANSRNPSNVPYFFDENQGISNTLNIKLFPVLLIVDENNTCVFQLKGYNPSERNFQFNTIVEIIESMRKN